MVTLYKRTWAVIENAGYEGEWIAREDLPSMFRAIEVMEKLYPDQEEREALHVDVAWKTEEGWYSYDY
jgi:hypothetical protein